MLHTLSGSPYAAINLAALLRYVNRSDTIVLLQDGVMAGLQGSEAVAQLRASGAALYALSPDLLARGITSHLDSHIIPIDYAQFVALTVQHPSQIAW